MAYALLIIAIAFLANLTYLLMLMRTARLLRFGQTQNFESKYLLRNAFVNAVLLISSIIILSLYYLIYSVIAWLTITISIIFATFAILGILFNLYFNKRFCKEADIVIVRKKMLMSQAVIGGILQSVCITYFIAQLIRFFL